jgi:hypothetical protein
VAQWTCRPAHPNRCDPVVGGESELELRCCSIRALRPRRSSRSHDRSSPAPEVIAAAGTRRGGGRKTAEPCHSSGDAFPASMEQQSSVRRDYWPDSFRLSNRNPAPLGKEAADRPAALGLSSRAEVSSSDKQSVAAGPSRKSSCACRGNTDGRTYSRTRRAPRRRSSGHGRGVDFTVGPARATPCSSSSGRGRGEQQPVCATSKQDQERQAKEESLDQRHRRGEPRQA